MELDSSSDPLQCLPSELALLILEKLGPKDVVKSCAIVCTQWHALCVDDMLWRSFCLQACTTKRSKKAMKKMKAASVGISWKTAFSNYGTKDGINVSINNILLAFPFQSSTLLDSSHKKTLRDWLDPAAVWKLHYKASIDGFTHDEFHKKCDNQGPTVTIVLSKNGSLFGGYNPQSWCISGDVNLNRSSEAFIFSLVNPHKTPPVRLFPRIPTSACFSISYYGPTWGAGYDLGIMGFPQGKEMSAWTRLGCSYSPPDKSIYTGHPHFFLAGEPRDFDIVEVEVFTLKRVLTPLEPTNVDRKQDAHPNRMLPLNNNEDHGVSDEPPLRRIQDSSSSNERDRDRERRTRKGIWDYFFG